MQELLSRGRYVLDAIAHRIGKLRRAEPRRTNKVHRNTIHPIFSTPLLFDNELLSIRLRAFTNIYYFQPQTFFNANFSNEFWLKVNRYSVDQKKKKREKKKKKMQWGQHCRFAALINKVYVAWKRDSRNFARCSVESLCSLHITVFFSLFVTPFFSSRYVVNISAISRRAGFVKIHISIVYI